MYSSDFLLLEIDPSRVLPVLSSIDYIDPFCLRYHQVAFGTVEQRMVLPISSLVVRADRTDILLATKNSLIFCDLVVLDRFVTGELGTLELLEDGEDLFTTDGEHGSWGDRPDGQIGVETVGTGYGFLDAEVGARLIDGVSTHYFVVGQLVAHPEGALSRHEGHQLSPVGVLH